MHSIILYIFTFICLSIIYFHLINSCLLVAAVNWCVLVVVFCVIKPIWWLAADLPFHHWSYRIIYEQMLQLNNNRKCVKDLCLTNQKEMM